MSKKISVIIPVYNAEDKLQVCIDSVRQQTYDNLEIILINDGSTDNSLNLCKKYSGIDSRIIVLDKPNSGPAAARNTGLNRASGELVAFVDSDDYYNDKYSLEGMVKSLCEADLLISRYYRIFGDKINIKGLIETDEVVDRYTFLERLVKEPGSFYFSVLWNKLYKRDIIEHNKIRFKEQLAWGEDFCFNMAYYNEVKSVSHASVPRYCYVRTIQGQTWRTMFKVPRNIRTKMTMYRAFRNVYIRENLYNKYRKKIDSYIFYVTLFD